MNLKGMNYDTGTTTTHNTISRETFDPLPNQHAIGKYVVDFCVPRKKLIIELDGSQHLEQEEYDIERTASLELKGYRILRFWNNGTLNNIDLMLKVIWSALEE